MKYRISNQAKDDLHEIWLFTYQNWSVEHADRYFNLIVDEIEFVAQNFMAGKSVELTRKAYRVIKVKSHLIYYRKTENAIVEIVRILHQRMDIKKYLD
jgi:toxin ParE1/3/4